MRVDRWASAAAAALALAITPGLLRLVPPPTPLPERAPIDQPRVEVPPVGTEVAITPPETFEGEVAAPVAPAPTFTPRPVSADAEVFALLIGIDDYPGRTADLRSAVADVDTIDAALSGFGVPAGNRVVLRDGQATLAEVESAIRSLVAQGGANATYVFGYAGHARKLDMDTEALILADGQLLRDTDLAALLAPATTQRMWLLIASCFAGGFTEALAPGRVLTGAAGANQQAWEDPSLNASYLVHYLVREGWLLGRAGDSVQEAFAYADAAMAEERPNRRPMQVDQSGTPLLLGPGDPTSAIDDAPATPQSPPPRDPTPPPTTAPPPPEDDDPPCVLGLLYC